MYCFDGLFKTFSGTLEAAYLSMSASNRKQSNSPSFLHSLLRSSDIFFYSLYISIFKSFPFLITTLLCCEIVFFILLTICLVTISSQHGPSCWNVFCRLRVELKTRLQCFKYLNKTLQKTNKHGNKVVLEQHNLIVTYVQPQHYSAMVWDQTITWLLAKLPYW